MSNFVALLGTKGGPMIRPGSTMPTSSLLSLGGQRVVVDCGLGVARGIVNQDMSLKDLSRIFITHLHSDPYLELGPHLHTIWVAGLKTPIRVWGPTGPDACWQGFLAAMAFDIATRIEDEGQPDLRAHTMAEYAAKTAAAAGAKALALHHLIPSDDPAFTEKDWLENTAPHFHGPIRIGKDGLRVRF